MNRHLIRIVASGLVLCLLADPAFSAPWNITPRIASANPILFACEALTGRSRENANRTSLSAKISAEQNRWAALQLSSLYPGPDGVEFVNSILDFSFTGVAESIRLIGA